MTLDAAPHYLDDPLVREIVDILLAKADKRRPEKRSRKPLVRIAPHTTPAWFTTTDGSAKEFSWRRLKDLAKAHLIDIDFHPSKRFLPAPWTLSPAIRLALGGEERFREWLDRPFPLESGIVRWRKAVADRSDLTWDFRQALSVRPLLVGDRPSEEVLERLLQATKEYPAGIARRLISARTFWGLSKLFDSRDDLLVVLGEVPSTWRKPALLVHIDAPVEQPEGLLFVENWEAFDAMCEGTIPRPSNWWILFAAGFKTSSERLLDGANVRWFGRAGRLQLSDAQLQAGIVRAQRQACTTAFWGDLDFAGLSILRELRRVLPGAVAWTPGYRMLLARLGAGDGHTPAESRKAGQTDPGSVGCAYADGVLLPAIRAHVRFVDQEAVCFTNDWRLEPHANANSGHSS